jgi:vitamin B12/bleomycin/antimicrobial peptide transport system ATP-binding/permease protein
LTHWIGKPLVQLDFRQERYEADFRFALARVREYSEQVALLRGENAEKSILGGRFNSIVVNFYAIVGRTLKLLTFTTSYFQANVVIPYIIIAPYFFIGKISLGQMTQTGGAFGRVESALTFFIARYQLLASYKAVVERLTTFRSAIDEARALGTKPPRIERNEHSGRDLVLRNLSLCLPNGREVVHVDGLIFEAGTTTLVSGPSGSGKSTLFRAISGIWPYGQGMIESPADARMMLLPQRPYGPSGTLKNRGHLPFRRGSVRRRDRARGPKAGASRIACRRNRPRGQLGPASFRWRTAASRNCAGHTRQAGLVVPRRSDIGA